MVGLSFEGTLNRKKDVTNSLFRASTTHSQEFTDTECEWETVRKEKRVGLGDYHSED